MTNNLSDTERKNMDNYLAKIRGEPTGMFDNSLSETEKRKQIRAFFFPIPRPDKPDDDWFHAALISIFVGSFFLFITENVALALFGGGGLLFGLIWLDENVLNISANKKKYEEKNKERSKLLNKWKLQEDDLNNKPKISQIDLWLKEDMQKVINRALDKLGLEELIKDPMVIYGPLFWTTYGIPDDELVTVKITDGTIRFSCYQLVVVCLSAERIATYSADFNFLRNAFVGEKTIEFLYRDIVSVSTEEKSTNYNLPNGSTMRRAQVFRLVVPGDNIEVVINSPEIKELLGGEAALTDHDKSVRVIREMLRDKKG